MIKLCKWTGHWWTDHPGWGVRVCRMCSRKEKAFYEDGFIHYREWAEDWDCQP